jgi:uncharacterized protein YggE
MGKELVMTRTMFVFAALSAFAACQRPQLITLPAGGAEIEKPGQMQVTGTATLDVSPDCADLTLTLGADASRPAAATEDVDHRETALVAALGKLGVAPTELKLTRLDLQPVFEEFDHRSRLTHYHAELVITATTHDFAKIADIMEAGAQAGATAISSQLRRSDMSALKKQVRDMALAAAKDKAEQTAHALGFKVGRVVSVIENQGGFMWDNAYFPQANVSESRNAGTALGGTLQSLSLNVTIGFEIPRET